MKRIFSLCLPLAAGAMLLSQINTAQGAQDPRQRAVAGRAAAASRAAAAAPRAAAPHFAARPAAIAHAPQQRNFAPRPSAMTNRSFAQRSYSRPSVAQNRASFNRSAVTQNHASVNRAALSQNRASFNRTATAQNRGSFNRNAMAQNRIGNRSALNRHGVAQNGAINPNVYTRGQRNLAYRTNGNRFNGGAARGNNQANANATATNGRFAGANQRSNIASNQFAFRSGNFHNNWNPGRTYAWNHHHWRNYNGVWAVYDAGWPYDWNAYPYPFVYDNTVYYNGDVYDPGTADEPAAVAENPNNIVSSVQSTLANDGYNPGPIDGVPGAQTEQAVAQYQADNNMPATGQIDSALLDSLGL